MPVPTVAAPRASRRAHRRRLTVGGRAAAFVALVAAVTGGSAASAAEPLPIWTAGTLAALDAYVCGVEGEPPSVAARPRPDDRDRAARRASGVGEVLRAPARRPATGSASAGALGTDPRRVAAVSPWAASLEIHETARASGQRSIAHCAATAVAPRWLLTAAHCVGETRWRSVTATFHGAAETASTGRGAPPRRSVDLALCHRGFQPDGLAHDVALLRLSRPAPIQASGAGGFPLMASTAETAAARPGLRATAPVGAPAVELVATPRIGGAPRPTDLIILDPARASDGMIVAAPARNEISLCFGESGGPLMADLGRGPRLLGVFSSVDAVRNARTGELAPLCRGFEARSYFTPVAPYRAWVAQVIAACEADPARCGAPGRALN